MVITRDEAGRSIVLHEESISFWKNGGVGLLMLVPFCTIPVVLVSLFLREPEAAQDAGAWVPVFGAAAWVVLSGAAVAMVVRNARRLALLSADRSAGDCVVEEWAPLAFLARRSAIPIDEVERLELWTVREFGRPKGANLPLRLRLDLRGRRTYDLPYRLEVHGLDRREEALDLAVRFAHVVGLGHQRVAKNDHIEFRVLMTRTPEEGSSAVPPLSAPAEYERDQVGIQAGLPEGEIPPFDPQGFQSEYRVMRWEPGNEVLLVRLATPAQARMNTLGCGVFFLFWAVLAWAGSLSAGLPAFMPGAATLAGLAAWALAADDQRRRARRGEVRVDWGLRRFTIDRFGSRLEVPFEVIESVEIRALHNEHLDVEGASTCQVFRVQLFLRLRRALRNAVRTELIVETSEVRDPLRPYRSGLPLGVELAGALGVPYVYHDYR